MKKFAGTGVALITPFSEGEIDFPALANIIDFVIKRGVNYIVLLGSTGEASLLSEQEQREVLTFSIQQINGRVALVAGNFGGVSTHQLCKKISQYNFNGIDAILSSCPSYVKPGQTGLYQHFHHVSASSPVPVILYNVPSRTSVNMSWETTIQLAKDHENIIAIKEASNDLLQCEQIAKNRPDGFLLLSGDDLMTLAILELGGNGVISVIANAYPSEFSAMVNYALDDNLIRAKELEQLLHDMHQWLYIEGNPSGIKAAMEILGLCKRELRLPLMPMTENNYRKLKEEMALVKSLPSD
jgi:4-hydroxy-tetrahydrodipicolinate synthase